MYRPVTLVFWLGVVSSTSATLYYLDHVNSSYRVVEGRLRPDEVSTWQANAYYLNSMNQTGWDIFEVATNPDLENEDQVYAAGFLEGYVTAEQLYYHFNNSYLTTCGGNFYNSTKPKEEVCKQATDYLKTNYEWAKAQAEQNKKDEYWHHVHLFYRQIEGLTDGYGASNQTNKLNIMDMMFLTMQMDFSEVFSALVEQAKMKNETQKEPPKVPPKKQENLNNEHCSALIKLVPDYSEILFGHATWTEFTSMNRQLKRYTMALKRVKGGDLIPGVRAAFSSYPGSIISIDDYYQLSSGLVVMETTNTIFDYSLYANFKPKGVLMEAVRNLIANRLATNGSSWGAYFSHNNSGTYNNQFMVLDMKHFTRGVQPAADLLWVCEQEPGNVTCTDQTQHLVSELYWASYNIPFYQKIYKDMGYLKEMTKVKNATLPEYSYENNPRGKIFQREEWKVVDLDSMLAMLRFNQYKTDNYSYCKDCLNEHDPSASIASRYDLRHPANSSNPEHGPLAFGATDAKVSNHTSFGMGMFMAIAGPPYSDNPEDGLPPFQFSKFDSGKVPHQGIPDLMKFNRVMSMAVLGFPGRQEMAPTTGPPVVKLTDPPGTTTESTGASSILLPTFLLIFLPIVCRTFI